jgi:hypothetical protein
MRDSWTDDELYGSRQVVLVLRLVLDGQAQLHHGELLDADATRQGRFATLTGMTETVARWIERQQEIGLEEPVRQPMGK